ncbi:hypothetical protein F5Y17DRAFT_417836 [Xylariaceae sp. FL0594]|nr:hypothetical protein F5Y17DRAFT_417836 [Xylariaceae sp. FL0594]
MSRNMFSLLKLGEMKFGKKTVLYKEIGESSRSSADDAPSLDEKASSTTSSSSSSSSHDSEPFLEHNSYGYLRRPARWGSSIWAVPWLVSTVVLSLVNMGLGVRLYQLGHGTYETGYRTDFQTAVHLIEVQERRFTTPPRDVMRSDVLVAWDPAVPRYVGIPTPEVDAAWNKLTGPFMQATAEEALDLPGASLQHGHYWATTTVQHTLHCLNHIRKALYGPEYYPIIRPEAEDHWPHLNHCVDIIRQSLECVADITPLPLTFNADAGIYGADVQRMHTCRNYDPLIAYFKSRGGDWREGLN